MAINIDTTLKGYEYRIIREGTFTNDSGEKVPYMSLVLEHPDTCEQSRVSVPEKLRVYVKTLPLSKGCLVDATVNVRAGDNYSSMRLVSVEHVYTTDGEVLV